MTVGWFMKAIAQYADFHSRARRREFWWFIVIAYLVQIALWSFTAVTLAGAVEDGVIVVEGVGISGWVMLFITVLVGLFLLIPYWAVVVRRLHDTDHSGWWLILGILVPVMVWIFGVFDGTPGPNQYGPDPKELERGTGA